MEELSDLYEWMQIEKENNLILEFANMSPAQHKLEVNLGLHVMQPTDKKLKHGPRAKFFSINNPKDNFCITINDNPKVIGKYDKLISERDLNKLVQHITQFKIPLLNFWYNPYMFTDELERQMDKVRNGKPVEATYLDKINQK